MHNTTQHNIHNTTQHNTTQQQHNTTHTQRQIENKNQTDEDGKNPLKKKTSQNFKTLKEKKQEHSQPARHTDYETVIQTDEHEALPIQTGELSVSETEISD